MRITGEAFSTLTTGIGGAAVADLLEARGAVVARPTAAEWLLYLAWQRGGLCPSASNAERTIRGLHARYRRAAGLKHRELPDLDDWARLASPHYPVAAPGGSVPAASGSAHLEVAAYLAAARDRSADLVISVKPFASTTSSAISDAVLHALAQRGGPAFLSLEITGDADVQIESRIDLALDAVVRRRGRVTLGARTQAARSLVHQSKISD